MNPAKNRTLDDILASMDSFNKEIYGRYSAEKRGKGLGLFVDEVDRKVIAQEKVSVVSGYLNLREQDGWKEGSDSRLGCSFVKHILSMYFLQYKGRLGCNATVVKNVVNAFKKCETFLPEIKDAPENCRPRDSRICYDSSVKGHERHTISRLVGNLGSSYDLKKPFFEVLVNSARTSLDNSACSPFSVSVYVNEEELEKRRTVLASMKDVPGQIAAVYFYSSSLQKPGDFLKKYSEKLGPNSTRLLQALSYLAQVTIAAQSTGNCWMKQPMRSLLVAIYVELISEKKDLSPTSAWDEAKTVYKDIQKVVAIPLVQELLRDCNVSAQMKRVACAAIEKQKKL